MRLHCKLVVAFHIWHQMAAHHAALEIGNSTMILHTPWPEAGSSVVNAFLFTPSLHVECKVAMNMEVYSRKSLC